MSCGKKLKATKITYWLAALCFIALFSVMIHAMPNLKKQYRDWAIKDIIGPSIAFAICLIAYPFCGYVKDE